MWRLMKTENLFRSVPLRCLHYPDGLWRGVCRILLFLVLIVCTGALSARAQSSSLASAHSQKKEAESGKELIEENNQYVSMKIREIPDYSDLLSEEDFLAGSDLYEEKPLGDRYLEYNLRLPQGWQRVFDGVDYKRKEIEDAGLTQRILGMVGSYYGPGTTETPSRFVIEAVELDHDVTAKNWFIHEILSRGYTLQALHTYSNRRVEAIYVLLEKGNSFVVRTTAIINGSRMIMASYYVPESRWMKEKAWQQRVISSFRFLTPEQTKIEAVREYAFLDLLRFKYPVSWRLVAPDIYSTEGMEAHLIYSEDGKTLIGKIDITIVAVGYTGALQDEVSILKKKMSDMGFVTGDLVEKRNERYHFMPHIFFSNVEVYDMKNETVRAVDHEFWLAVLQESRYYYVISMLTPSREDEYYIWVRNAEAFKTVIESMRP